LFFLSSFAGSLRWNGSDSCPTPFFVVDVLLFFGVFGSSEALFLGRWRLLELLLSGGFLLTMRGSPLFFFLALPFPTPKDALILVFSCR